MSDGNITTNSSLMIPYHPFSSSEPCVSAWPLPLCAGHGSCISGQCMCDSGWSIPTDVFYVNTCTINIRALAGLYWMMLIIHVMLLLFICYKWGKLIWKYTHIPQPKQEQSHAGTSGTGTTPRSPQRRINPTQDKRTPRSLTSISNKPHRNQLSIDLTSTSDQHTIRNIPHEIKNPVIVPATSDRSPSPSPSPFQQPPEEPSMIPSSHDSPLTLPTSNDDPTIATLPLLSPPITRPRLLTPLYGAPQPPSSIFSPEISSRRVTPRSVQPVTQFNSSPGQPSYKHRLRDIRHNPHFIQLLAATLLAISGIIVANIRLTTSARIFYSYQIDIWIGIVMMCDYMVYIYAILGWCALGRQISVVSGVARDHLARHTFRVRLLFIITTMIMFSLIIIQWISLGIITRDNTQDGNDHRRVLYIHLNSTIIVVCIGLLLMLAHAAYTLRFLNVGLDSLSDKQRQDRKDAILKLQRIMIMVSITGFIIITQLLCMSTVPFLLSNAAYAFPIIISGPTLGAFPVVGMIRTQYVGKSTIVGVNNAVPSVGISVNQSK